MRIALLTMLLLVGCAKPAHHFKGTAHTHPYHIQVGHPLSLQEEKEISKLINETFIEIDKVYNHLNPTSELSRGISTPKIKHILFLARSFYELSDGWYNPKLGDVTTPFKTIKHPSAIPPLYDLHGMLKGFTIDTILEKLTQKGYKNLYVEWGGDIATRGNHPKGRPWKVLVNKKTFPLINKALATSGCQEQLWEIKGRTYTHIANPHTRDMLEVTSDSVHLVSVMAPTCALADALATACMACGSLDRAFAFAKKIKKKRPEIEFWITSYELQD